MVSAKAIMFTMITAVMAQNKTQIVCILSEYYSSQ